MCLGEAGFARLTKKSAVRFDFDSLLLLLLLFLLVLIKSGKKKNRLTKMDSLFAAILILPYGSSSFFKKECFFLLHRLHFNFCLDELLLDGAENAPVSSRRRGETSPPCHRCLRYPSPRSELVGAKQLISVQIR